MHLFKNLFFEIGIVGLIVFFIQIHLLRKHKSEWIDCFKFYCWQTGITGVLALAFLITAFKV